MALFFRRCSRRSHPKEPARLRRMRCMTRVVALCSLLWSSTTAVGGSSPFRYHFVTQEAGAIDLWPCFSPDGKTILFSRSMDKGRTWDLFVVPAAGGAPRRFPAVPLSVSATRANWSTTNGLIAFTGARAGNGNAIWLIRSDGSEPREISSSPERKFYLAWGQ